MDILVVVDGGLVETLQASPLVRSLAAGMEGAGITLACPPGAEVVARHIPGLAEVLPLRALLAGRPPLGDLVGAYRALRTRRLSAAVLCSTRSVAPPLVYFAGVARRVGLARGGSSLFLSDPVEVHGEENRAVAWLRLASALGVQNPLPQASFDPGPEARRLAEERLVGAGFEDGRLMVAVAPGTGYSDPLPEVPDRELTWEPERWAHLCNQLAHRHGGGVVVLGTESDRPFVEAVLLDVEAPTLDLCGEAAGLEEVAAVLERCDLLVCGDSPLLHLAAAVGTPSLGLFGPTQGRLRAPYGAEHRVVQAAEPSLRGIRVDDVLAGIEAPLPAA